MTDILICSRLQCIFTNQIINSNTNFNIIYRYLWGNKDKTIVLLNLSPPNFESFQTSKSYTFMKWSFQLNISKMYNNTEQS